MEKTMKNWITTPKTPFIGQDSLRTYLLIALLVLIVLAALFGPLTDIISFEDQPDNGAALENKFKHDITKLLLKSSNLPRSDTWQLPDSLRVFDDMCIFIRRQFEFARKC